MKIREEIIKKRKINSIYEERSIYTREKKEEYSRRNLKKRREEIKKRRGRIEKRRKKGESILIVGGKEREIKRVRKRRKGEKERKRRGRNKWNNGRLTNPKVIKQEKRPGRVRFINPEEEEVGIYEGRLAGIPIAGIITGKKRENKLIYKRKIGGRTEKEKRGGKRIRLRIIKNKRKNEKRRK